VRRWWHLTKGRRLIVVGLVVPAALAVAATAVLAVLTVGATRQLSDNVRVTQDLVDGNVRTLSQVQRELLRLEDRVVEPTTTPDELELGRALTSQRVQEGTLDYQGRTLADQALLQRARDLAEEWRGGLDSRLRAVIADPSLLTPAERRSLADDIIAFELRYNQLVSDAEIRRKQDAAAANAATDNLVHDTRLLLAGVVFTLVSLFALVAGMVRVLLVARRSQLSQAERLQDARRLLQRHSVAVQTTDNLVVITDASGTVEWVNEAFTRRTGYAMDEVLGTVPGRLLQGPDTDPETVRFMRERIEAREPFTCEVLNYTRDGSPYWVAIEVQPIVDDAGEVSGFVAVQSDVTKRRLTEAALRAAKETAEETARTKERFLASMSHEIRTPLNAVLGLTELLLDTELEPEQRAYVSTARQSGRHLLAIVNDILDYSALESGRVEVERTRTEPRAVVGDVCAMLQPMADREGLGLAWSASDAVPRSVCTDPVRLRQVLINLVGNGLKFTDRGGVSIALDYRPADGPDGGDPRLVVVVRDTGIGIPRDRLDRVFEPFTQMDASTTRTHGGTGLGLAICMRIARRLGGALGVDSVPGQGSVFTFELPVGVDHTDDGGADPGPLSLDAADAGSAVSLAVLVAEDDPVNRMVALHMLRRLGVEADVATDGVEALAATEGRAYDLVLMDVNMPHLDGLAATARVRARGGHQPRIVALTADARDGDRERVLAAGMDDYLSKPYTLDDLERALAAVTT
jgi:hypothetical protein